MFKFLNNFKIFTTCFKLSNFCNIIKIQKPNSFSAIEAWVIACIIFVFGALGEYTVILLKLKLTKLYPNKPRHSRKNRRRNRNQNGPPAGKEFLRKFILFFEYSNRYYT